MPLLPFLSVAQGMDLLIRLSPSWIFSSRTLLLHGSFRCCFRDGGFLPPNGRAGFSRFFVLPRSPPDLWASSGRRGNSGLESPADGFHGSPFRRVLHFLAGTFLMGRTILSVRLSITKSLGDVQSVSVTMKRESDQYISRSLSRKITPWRRVLKLVAPLLKGRLTKKEEEAITSLLRET